MPSYHEEVSDLEQHIGPFGFKSTQARLTQNRDDAFAAYEQAWGSSEGGAKLRGRTPVTLDRDRVLYSSDFHRLDDKHHVLLVGTGRLSRNYTTHALRAAHVARSVATRLALNSDFAEAVVLGSKVGSTPFVHRGKQIVADWAKSKIDELDNNSTDNEPRDQLLKGDANSSLAAPDWVHRITSPSIRRRVDDSLPWASGWPQAPIYSSGSQSYWSLVWNPFTRTPTGTQGYLAATMYGIWRHSLQADYTEGFEHLLQHSSGRFEINNSDMTHEAILARYCDDVTWIIENLSEASRAAALSEEESPYTKLAMRGRGKFPEPIRMALVDSDSGRLYSYFVDDLVSTSRGRLDRAEVAQPGTTSGNENVEKGPLVGLSETAHEVLGAMREFLESDIFVNRRIRARNETIDGILRNALQVTWTGKSDVFEQLVARRARLDNWGAEHSVEAALSNFDDPTRRVQLTVDLIAGLSDKEVLELVGLE